jgi:hypothetical protein
MPAPPITPDLIQELVARELREHPEQYQPQPKMDLGIDTAPSVAPVNPNILRLLAGLADAGSTYAALKAGGREVNPLLGFAHDNPLMTSLGALGGYGLTKLATAMLHKKAPAIADAVDANLGAEQLTAAITNTFGTSPGRSGFDEYHDMMQRARLEQQRRK